MFSRAKDLSVFVLAASGAFGLPIAFVRCTPIRLAPNAGSVPWRLWGAPPTLVERLVRRRLRRRSDAQQAPEGVEWVEPPVEAKRELVQVRLKVLRRDAVVNSMKSRMKSGSDVGNGSVVDTAKYCRIPSVGKQPDRHG